MVCLEMAERGIKLVKSVDNSEVKSEIPTRHSDLPVGRQECQAMLKSEMSVI